MTPFDTRVITRRYLVLNGLRWLPTGLRVPILVLLFTSRGFSLTQFAAITTVMTVTTFVLELPTGGLADSLGRRRVLLLGNVFLLLSNAGLAWLALSTTPPPMTLLLPAIAAMGVYRALESGPLEAWFVDALHEADPDADVETGLGRAGTVTGFSIAAGSLLAGGVIAWDPIPAIDPMGLVILISMVLVVVQVVALVVLMVEVRPATGWTAVAASVRGVPSVISSTLSLARTSRVLGLLLVVEATWAVGMVAFENLFPVRLEALVGSTESAAALMGPVSAGAWAASGLGAGLIVRVSKRLGGYQTGALLRLLQGATIVTMGLVAGPVGLIGAFIGTYLIHGASNPIHMNLLHRQVTSGNRTTAVSLNSMVGFASFSVAGILVGMIADFVSVQVGMFVTGAVAALGSLAYLKARRVPDATPAESDRSVQPPPATPPATTYQVQ